MQPIYADILINLVLIKAIILYSCFRTSHALDLLRTVHRIANKHTPAVSNIKPTVVKNLFAKFAIYAEMLCKLNWQPKDHV